MKELRAAKRKGGAALDMRAMLAPLVSAPEQPGRGERQRRSPSAGTSTELGGVHAE